MPSLVQHADETALICAGANIDEVHPALFN